MSDVLKGHVIQNWTLLFFSYHRLANRGWAENLSNLQKSFWSFTNRIPTPYTASCGQVRKQHDIAPPPPRCVFIHCSCPVSQLFVYLFIFWMLPVARYLVPSRSFTAFFVSPVQRSKRAPTPHLEQIDQTKNQHACLFIHVFIYLLIRMQTAFVPPPWLSDCCGDKVASLVFKVVFFCSREFSLLFYFFPPPPCGAAAIREY